MRKKIIFLAFAIFIPLFVQAQELRPVIKFNPFVSYGISGGEARFIESLLQSYVSDAGQIIYQNDGSQADYTLSGSVYCERNNRIFTLKIHNANTNEITSTTTVHPTTGDLALRARALVEAAFRKHTQTTRKITGF